MSLPSLPPLPSLPTGPSSSTPAPSNETFSNFFKGFVAGAFLSNISKRLVLGAIVGITAGAYYQQEFGAPDVKQEMLKWKKIVLESVQSGKK